MSYEMTPLCGFGMGDTNLTPSSPEREKVVVTPTEGATIKMPDSGVDGMLIMKPLNQLDMVTLDLSLNGDDLQFVGITSMEDIENVMFINGTVKNFSGQLLKNQAQLLQRIDKAEKIWTTLS